MYADVLASAAREARRRLATATPTALGGQITGSVWVRVDGAESNHVMFSPPRRVIVSLSAEYGCGLQRFCKNVTVTYQNFPAGNHTVRCYSDGTLVQTYATSSSSSTGVYRRLSAPAFPPGSYSRPEIWARVDGVESNHVTY